MKKFNERTILGNLSCQKELVDFKSTVVEYFNNCQFEGWDNRMIENEVARAARSTLNQNLRKIQKIILGANISSSITYSPPPMIGGYRQDIDLVANIFYLHQFRIEPTFLLDVADRAIGVYREDQLMSLIRTFNPLFWFGTVLDYFVSIPFKILRKAGINTAGIESSFIGKFLKFIFWLVSLAAAIVTVAQPLGWLDYLKTLLRL